MLFDDLDVNLQINSNIVPWHKLILESVLKLKNAIFTCVALAKAGLVMGPLRPSVHLSVRPSAHPKHFRGTKFV